MSGPDTILISLGEPMSRPFVGGKSSTISMGHFCPDTGSVCRCPLEFHPLPPVGGLADEINAAHDRAAQCLSEGLSHATHAGELLLRAKADVGHGGWLKWLKQNVSFSARTAQLYMQLAKLAPDAQRVAHLPLRRTVLELQRLDRDARRQADRQEQEEEARWDQHSAAITRAALGAVHTQLDQHDDRRKADPIGPVVLEIVHAQLDALDEARTVADELIEVLLFNAVEAGVSIRSLIDALGRRFGPGTRREWSAWGNEIARWRAEIAWRSTEKAPPIGAGSSWSCPAPGGARRQSSDASNARTVPIGLA